ncbi:type III PLP-dependent enzyme domain-containing protein [Streptacidiphilus griseoplanus]|uniref:alanine racemase n=1 Tax=Peterkaempfera griseoplana TaxID=66896 RepID=UPI0006E178BA|nr:alanine racemase [Peterkaempfera griseoplana]
MVTEGIDGPRVAALAQERLDWCFKAVPAAAWGRTVADYLATGPALDDLGTPLLTLDAAALHHNLATMAAWCATAGVELAPHGKTTMAPALWQRQLAAGCWGITLANLPQLHVGRAFGLRRIQLAGTLLDPAGLAWLAAELDRDPAFRFISWVDSEQSVALMDAALRNAGAERPVEVCVELGAPGGRTGCRDQDQAMAVARAVDRAPTLQLTGVSGYEGALAHDAGAGALATVQRYLRELAGLHRRLRSGGLLDGAGEELVTAGGSAYFDLVAEVLGPLAGEHGNTRVVLRSGAYLVHDDGFYHSVSPLARGAGPRPFRSAMHGWARVVSRPEPALALLDGGKRDLPYDEGLPMPQLVRGRGPLTAGRITAVNDQHAFLRDAQVEVGEVLRLGLSHPCTAFDKWSLIPVLDSADSARPQVVDLIRTFF